MIMHKDFEIHLDDLSKMEGHGAVDIVVKSGEVKDVKLRISETKRFFKQAIVGKSALSVHQLVSRICGTCSIAHLTCCIEALEYAFGMRPSEQTAKLRELSMIGTVLRDHAMHLYLFCLPDLLNKDSILDFNDKEKHWIEDAFMVKKAGNRLATLVAGRAVHALYPQICGFSSIPSKEQAKDMAGELKNSRDAILEAIDIFHSSPLSFENKTDYIALVNKDFSFVNGEIKFSNGNVVAEDEFEDHLHRIVIPYSQSLGFKYDGQMYRVGALARLNLNKTALCKETRKDANKALSVFPSHNIFDNELAQAIEMLHCVDHAVAILESSDFKEELPPRITATKGVGIGVVEAPRGTLYHELAVDDAGLIKEGTFIIPTSQNQVTMEKDIGLLVQKCLQKNRPKEEISYEIEKLIRAYDPCMSCATHFLRVNWK